MLRHSRLLILLLVLVLLALAVYRFRYDICSWIWELTGPHSVLPVNDIVL